MIICEVFHRLKPRVWTAKDRLDFTNKVAAANPRSGEELDTYEQCHAYLARDLRALFIFEDADDIADRIHEVPCSLAASMLEAFL